MNLREHFENMIRDELAEVSYDFRRGSAAIAAYMAERAEHLANSVDEPGFAWQVKIERNNVLLFAGLSASRRIAGIQQRLFGLLDAALRIGSIFLAEAALDLEPPEEEEPEP